MLKAIAKPLVGAAIVMATSVAMMSAVQAEEWKPKKLTIVVAHGVGGGQDRITRAFYKTWSKHLGAKIRVVNKSGASGRVGFNYFLKQPQDGTVVLSTAINTTGTMYIQQQPGWVWQDTINNLGVIAIDPGAIFVRKDSPLKDMKDVIALGKGDKAVMGISSWASTENIALQQMMTKTDTKFQIIPIGGGGDLVTAVLGKHLPVGFGKVSNIHKSRDRVRYLAVTLEKNPVPGLTNNVATLNEQLGTDIISMASFRSVLVPADLPKKHPERYKKLKDSFEAAKDDPEFIALAKKGGISPELIADMDHDELMATLELFWQSYGQYGQILKQEQKLTFTKSTITKVKKNGKKIYFTNKSGKEISIKVDDEDTEMAIGPGKAKEKEGMEMLEAGMSCNIGYAKVPVLALELTCT